MRLYARIALLLGGFLLAAGLVYGGISKERIGLVLLLLAGSGFTYVGLYARRAVRAADRAAPEAARAEPGVQAPVAAEAPVAEAPVAAEPEGVQAPVAAEPEGVQAPVAAEPEGAEARVPAPGPPVEEVRPTIWPLVFSLAGAGIVAGVLASHWILLVGGVLAVAAAGGWFREVLVQRQEHH